MTQRSEVTKGPCIVCGATDYPLSFGGPGVCPACDCGHFRLGGKWEFRDAVLVSGTPEQRAHWREYHGSQPGSVWADNTKAFCPFCGPFRTDEDWQKHREATRRLPLQEQKP